MGKMEFDKLKQLEDLVKKLHEGRVKYPANGTSTLKWQDDVIVWDEYKSGKQTREGVRRKR